ncbi:MAG TPA: DUF4156 domain-containing protein [Polyangiaceae bacterium]
MLTRFAVFLIPLVAVGCVLRDVPVLEPEGKKIKLVREADKPVDCDAVADVSGTSRAQDEKEARKGAENDIRNKAAQYEANFVVVEVERTKQAGTGPYKEVFLGGKAMSCVTPEMEAAQEKADAERKEKEEQAAAERERQEAIEREKEAAEADEKQKEKGADDE